MVRTFAVVVFLVLASTPVSAQLSQYGESCAEGIWHTINVEDYRRHNVEERAEVFASAVRSVQDRDTRRRDINVVVIDCPMQGHVVRAVKQHAGMSNLVVRIPPSYGIYVTARYLRNTEEDTLVRAAHKQACLIVVGAVESAHRPAADPYTPQIVLCALTAAVLAGDKDHATWLARQLGMPVPGTD